MSDCQSVSLIHDKKCARPAGHLGLHRSTKKPPPRYGPTDTVAWGTNEEKH